MQALRSPLAAACLLVAAATAHAGSPAPTAAASHRIDFEDLAAGATVADQYAAWGVRFLANAYVGSDSPNGGWASNTDMTVVASTGADVSDLYGPPLVSGNLLRSYAGWLNEDGDASFVLAFEQPIASISVDFAGIGNGAGNTGLEIFTPQGALLARVPVAGQGQQTVRYDGSNIGFVVVLPGDLGDWVGVDNIAFTVATAVPEPQTWGLLALGLGLVGRAARRQRR